MNAMPYTSHAPLIVKLTKRNSKKHFNEGSSR